MAQFSLPTLVRMFCRHSSLLTCPLQSLLLPREAGCHAAGCWLVTVFLPHLQARRLTSKASVLTSAATNLPDRRHIRFGTLASMAWLPLIARTPAHLQPHDQQQKNGAERQGGWWSSHFPAHTELSLRTCELSHSSSVHDEKKNTKK
jgi:hypothetical protein